MSFSVILARLGVKGAVTLGGADSANKLVKLDADGLIDVSTMPTDISDHVANTSNPHSVTKTQVGLGNCDNTSDANKPISTLTQTALDLKATNADLTTHTSDATIHITSGQNSLLDALTVSATELNYVDGVTSAIQTQLDALLPEAGGAFTGLTGAGYRDTSAAYDVTLGFTSSTSLTAGRALTVDVVNASRTVKLAGNIDLGGNLTTTGSGTIALGGYTLTVPATGSAALLGIGNIFSVAQTISTTGTGLVVGSGAGNSSLGLRGTGATLLLAVGYGDSLSVGGQLLVSGGVALTGGSLLGRSATASVYLPSGGQMGFGSSGDNTGSNDALITRGGVGSLQLGATHATTPTAQTIGAHPVTTGTGADLTLQGGNGSVARGNVILFGGNRAPYDAAPSTTTIRDILISHGLMAAS